MIRYLFCFLGLVLLSTTIQAQTSVVRNDTIYVTNDVNNPIEFSKSVGKVLYISNIIPDDIPAKSRKLQIISSKSTEINVKLLTVVNDKDIIIPLELFEERYYTLYIKKGDATKYTKRIIIK